jgi:hypothetical protein
MCVIHDRGWDQQGLPSKLAEAAREVLLLAIQEKRLVEPPHRPQRRDATQDEGTHGEIHRDMLSTYIDW